MNRYKSFTLHFNAFRILIVDQGVMNDNVWRLRWEADVPRIVLHRELQFSVILYARSRAPRSAGQSEIVAPCIVYAGSLVTNCIVHGMHGVAI
jgi:hypothetical protein